MNKLYSVTFKNLYKVYKFLLTIPLLRKSLAEKSNFKATDHFIEVPKPINFVPLRRFLTNEVVEAKLTNEIEAEVIIQNLGFKNQEIKKFIIHSSLTYLDNLILVSKNIC